MSKETKVTLAVGGVSIALAIALYYLGQNGGQTAIVQGNDQLPESTDGANPIAVQAIPALLGPAQGQLPTPNGTTLLAGGSTINAPLYAPVVVENSYQGPTFDMAPYVFNQQPLQFALPPALSFPLASPINANGIPDCECDSSGSHCRSEIAGIYDGNGPLTAAQLVNTVPSADITALVAASQEGYNQYQTPNLSIAAAPVTAVNDQPAPWLADFLSLNFPVGGGERALVTGALGGYG